MDNSGILCKVLPGGLQHGRIWGWEEISIATQDMFV